MEYASDVVRSCKLERLELHDVEKVSSSKTYQAELLGQDLEEILGAIMSDKAVWKCHKMALAEMILDECTDIDGVDEVIDYIKQIRKREDI